MKMYLYGMLLLSLTMVSQTMLPENRCDLADFSPRPDAEGSCPAGYEKAQVVKCLPKGDYFTKTQWGILCNPDNCYIDKNNYLHCDGCKYSKAAGSVIDLKACDVVKHGRTIGYDGNAGELVCK